MVCDGKMLMLLKILFYYQSHKNTSKLCIVYVSLMVHPFPGLGSSWQMEKEFAVLILLATHFDCLSKCHVSNSNILDRKSPAFSKRLRCLQVA